MDQLRWEPDAGADPTTYTYTFGGAAPVASVKPGTVISTWTMDCFGGRVRSTTDMASEVCDPRLLNPQSGPFYVEGTVPGDTLAVHFISIHPRESWGVSSTVPFFGALTATPITAMLHTALLERTWIYEIDHHDGVVRYMAADTPFTAALPLDPMHGTVGVAPPLGEARSSLTPGSWGGNMDTPEMRAGVTCYLGVNVDGALMSLGDGHARQGEGETCGVAVECAMDTTFILEVLPGYATEWPRLESDEFLMTTGSARPLEDAFRIAHQQMVFWLAELTGMSHIDSYQFVSQASLTPIANVVDTNYTVVCKIPKSLLPGVVAMAGLHDRLRKAASAWPA
ncbi:MAG: acetamidase/formamidase family protein [Actinomycetota bacterium]